MVDSNTQSSSSDEDEDIKSTNNTEESTDKIVAKPERVQNDDEELDDTIFIRNVARFDTTQESLKAHMESNWGETVYCLLCKDRETGESKGTAFVKFKDPYDAGACLGDFEDREMQTKFFLDGRNLFVLPALNRNQMGEVKRASAKKIDVLSDKKKVKKPRWYRTAAPKDSSSAANDGTGAGQSHKEKSNSGTQKGGKPNKRAIKPDKRSKMKNQIMGDRRNKSNRDGAPKKGGGGSSAKKARKPHKVGGRPHAKNNPGSFKNKKGKNTKKVKR